MRTLSLLLGSLMVMTLAHSGVLAQDSELDRLREALRNATSQNRSLEDQRNAAQTRITKLEADNAALKTQLDRVRAQLKQLQQDYKQAVNEFNERLEERNQTLEKWKEAYTQAAVVARTKDAERARFEEEANAFKASTKTCTDKNRELVKVNKQILADYKNVTLGDALLAKEPVTGLWRTRVQNKLQDYDEKIQGHSVP